MNATLYGGHVVGTLSDSHLIQSTNDNCVLRYSEVFVNGDYQLENNGLKMAQDLTSYPLHALLG